MSSSPFFYASSHLSLPRDRRCLLHEEPLAGVASVAHKGEGCVAMGIRSNANRGRDAKEVKWRIKLHVNKERGTNELELE